MIQVGAFDAKTRLSELLKAVEGGEVVTITRRGRPVAQLRPVEGDAARREAAIAQIGRLRAEVEGRWSVDDILSARDDGRA